MVVVIPLSLEGCGDLFIVVTNPGLSRHLRFNSSKPTSRHDTVRDVFSSDNPQRKWRVLF